MFDRVDIAGEHDLSHPRALIGLPAARIRPSRWHALCQLAVVPPRDRSEAIRSDGGAPRLLCIDAGAARHAAPSPWSTDDFPNVPLTTQTGRRVRFRDDLVGDEVVVIDFVDASRSARVSAETSHLASVAARLGERVGRDVSFLSISVDPDADTPEVLREYARRHAADWPFLTGDAVDIALLRRRLGRYADDLRRGTADRDPGRIIGSRTVASAHACSSARHTGSPVETIGRWLTDWTRGSTGGGSVSVTAPGRLSEGERPVSESRSERVDVAALIDYLDGRRSGRGTRADALARSVRSGGDILHARGRERLDVTNARIGAVRRRDRVTAGYATLTNETASTAQIVALESPAFEHVELHEPAPHGDTARTREVRSLTVEAGDRVELSPGGRHLRMIGPRRPLQSGQLIGITLTFLSGRKRVVPFPVVEAVPAG